MQAIRWDNSMSTGVDSLDSQHKQLISWLNDLLEAMSLGRGRAEIDTLLIQLGGYAALHFDNEEACFEKYQCPFAAQNIEAHKHFVATFQALRDEFDRDGPSSHLVVRVESELMRWLAGHIKRTDTQLRPCVKPD
jgi:hemerythrin